MRGRFENVPRETPGVIGGEPRRAAVTHSTRTSSVLCEPQMNYATPAQDHASIVYRSHVGNGTPPPDAPYSGGKLARKC